MFKKIIIITLVSTGLSWLVFVIKNSAPSEPVLVDTSFSSSSTPTDLSESEVDMIVKTSTSVVTAPIVLELNPETTAQPVVKSEFEPENNASTTTARVVKLAVPFSTQAPLAEWSDSRQQDGCEEAAVLMAMAWAQGFGLDKTKAKQEILAMADYQIENYGSSIDTNSYDTVARIIKGYWGYHKVELVEKFNKELLIEILDSGRLILAPTNGQKLNNPNFTAPGPTTHMIVIKGYDFSTDQFITNDPGTRHGENYRYSSKIILNAIVDYPTGNHLLQDPGKQAIIVISK